MSDLSSYRLYLDRINEDRRHLTHLTYEWSRINSESRHLDGLAAMASVLSDNFLWLDGRMEMLDLPPFETVNAAGEIEAVLLGKALRITKRPDAPLKIFLGGHMDTVYGKEHPFQEARFLDENTLNGPGAADLKGGLVVMLKALEALERSPWAENIGWEVLINPDEEIGSPGSRGLLVEAAGRNHLGLVYEPALADGRMVDTRKGSGNFHLVVRGKSAHAGRDHALGRNALVALSEALLAVDALNRQQPGVTVNPAKVDGGGPLNVVPDLAVLRFNIRIGTTEEQAWVENELDRIVEKANGKDGIRAVLYGGFGRPPKPISDGMNRLKGLIQDSGGMLEQSIHWGSSGGVCDGNNLAAAGVPNIDTLGVRGGAIHSDEEYVLLDSLVERAQLSALLLMRLASGEISF